ncbi:MAG: hypothetical protein H6622_00375 [Halobacteriovoraceae bacterium]|nr:hypothetical protein [Halobacteriovoraceae bacterium]
MWFLLMITSLKYFQVTTLIEKQYKYIHSLENEFKILYGKEVINREGYSYLKNYPLISSYAHFIYVWFFPVFLILISSMKIIKDYPGTFWDFHFLLSIIIFFGVLASTIFYVIFQKYKR